MKLLKHIKKVAPIDNELDIQNLLSLMKSQNQRIGIYQENEKEEPRNGISQNGLTQEDKNALNMFSFRNNNENNSLSDKGYEYGLSDW